MPTRRILLKGLAAPALLLGFWRGRGQAVPLQGELPASPPQLEDRPTWRSPPRCYFAYPHDEAFNPATGNPILARIEEGPGARTFLEWDYRSGELRPIVAGPNLGGYGAVAGQSGELLVSRNGRSLAAVPLSGGRPETLVELRLGKGESLSGFAITPDGGRLLFGIRRRGEEGDMTEILELDRGSGRRESLCQVPFHANHFQYSPHDPSWMGFAHEGDIKRGQGRVWALHRENGMAMPRRLWSERDEAGKALFTGHERWAFDRLGAYVVAYRSSESREAGLYFVDALTYRARLVSASRYDWHCNVSRDGRWAVVDTMEPRGLPSHPGRISDIVLIEVETGRRRWMARARASNHPWHPHPHFDPAGQRLIYNDEGDAQAGIPGGVVMLEI